MKIFGLVVGVAVGVTLFQNCTPMLGMGGALSSSSILQTQSASSLELINDPAFRDGFDVLPSCENPDTDPACANIARYKLANPNAPDRAAARPTWNLAQWQSVSNLPAAAGPYDGGYAAIASTKRVVFYPDGRLELAVSGVEEFPNGYFSKKGVALIMGQNIAAPGWDQRDSGNLTEMKELMFNVDVRLMYEDQRIGAGYDEARAAAIFPINFTVQNLRLNADGSTPPGYGEYVWLQISPYDDRVAIPGPVDSLDRDTNMYMLSVPYTYLAGNNSMRSKQWVNMHGDILPRAKEAVQRAFQQGALKSGNLADYKIGGANIGYELTGMNDSTIQFRNLSLRVARLNDGSRAIDGLRFSSAGPIAGKSCVQMLEPSDPHTWDDNYLCSDQDLGLRWSFAGPIDGMGCTQIIEPADPDAWSDNYLCAPTDLGLRWSYAGPIPGRTCLSINETSDPHAWADNYLCGQ